MSLIQTSRSFGHAVRGARKARGWSQADLASRSGVSRPWLSELENGKRSVELGRALSVLGALGLAMSLVDAPEPGPGEVDLNEILGGSS